ncbi:MAG: hypothetical protein ABI616_02840 [Pseudomonadota bacterium]
MKKIDAGQFIGLLANLGTLVGLLLLVFELNQNRQLTRAQIRHELSMGIVEHLDVVANNSQLADVIRRGSSGEELTPDERTQFTMRSNAVLRYWEDVHYQYRQGLYDESEFEKQREAWVDSLSRSAGLVAYWCANQKLYSADFAKEIDGALTTHKCK